MPRFVNERGATINTALTEFEEQRFARTHIKPHHVVLELGARFGTVSCVINAQLADKRAQVSVEPDARVWAALEQNLAANGCGGVRLHKGFVSNTPLAMADVDLADGYGARSVPAKAAGGPPSISLRDLEAREGLRFTALVADCEGYLGTFLAENPQLYEQLEVVIFEADHWWRCDYRAIRRELEAHGFVGVDIGFQNAYIKMSGAAARSARAVSTIRSTMRWGGLFAVVVAVAAAVALVRRPHKAATAAAAARASSPRSETGTPRPHTPAAARTPATPAKPAHAAPRAVRRRV